MKRTPPVAVCTNCGAVSYRPDVINERCGNRYGGKRCSGTFGSAINNGDWEECPSCAGTGLSGEQECRPCSGSGWVYVRDRRRR